MIRFLDLASQYRSLKPEIDAAIEAFTSTRPYEEVERALQQFDVTHVAHQRVVTTGLSNTECCRHPINQRIEAFSGRHRDLEYLQPHLGARPGRGQIRLVRNDGVTAAADRFHETARDLTGGQHRASRAAGALRR